ncbi:MAG: tRNA pseudouridine(38-40) synthase TruA [Bacteroidales bacterium]|nr:tRNA pseudouridine(38-40) synthase TruA [Bacteroidales bacterium]
MTRYFIRLSYDGTNYHGWQRQPNGGSVQQLLEDTLSMMLRSEIMLTGAGRTDTGVHAAEYYAHFDSPQILYQPEREKLIFRLNNYLPRDIAIHYIFPVAPDIHARFSALSRTYKYYISMVKTPFRAPYTFYLYGYLDTDLMNEGAKIIVDTADFTSFSKVNSDTKTNLCTVTLASWENRGDELVFTITANRFLRNMVRAIVGTLLDMGKHKTDLDDLRLIIESKNRSHAGNSVPARGLHLVKIDYPEGALVSY